MAALMQGVQYGLSSQGSFDENKELIFVKLTDSAYRAIEDFLKNKNHSLSTPTIQFLGNEGRLSFPSAAGTHGFNFSLTSNADIEGPQGSFECIHQTSSKRLESLGQLALKMRIQAKDDVYEATKHRMAVAEEAQKKNRTREIKAGGPGIGKKVKLTPGMAAPRGRAPQPLEPVPPAATNANAAAQLPEVSPALRPSYGGSHAKPASASAFLNGYHNHLPNGNFNGTARAAPNHRHPGNPDIMKRPIRERLIQLLAVRNYKKPELLDRLHRDGLRERDRKQVPEVLKQVSMLRDNTYQLLRHLWNDVSDKWPFYSEQDRQMVKRRRPQNLTPPGGSDGGSSSGSGQSPTSTHPGSPPPTQAKRPGYVDGADGLPTKRQRISHYRRPPPTTTEPVDSGGGGGGGRYNIAARWSSASSGGFASSRSSHPSLTSALSRSSPVPKPAPPPAEEERPPMARQPFLQQPPPQQLPPPQPPPPSHPKDISNGGSVKLAAGSEPAPPQPPVPAREVVREHREPPVNNHQSHGASEESAASSALSGAANDTDGQPEYPDYLRLYTTILDSEQRSRYKADFNADYNEYRDLHAVVETVSRHFAQLEERLRQEEVNSPGWRSIKQQIMKEYQDNKRDSRHQEAKRRFQYLHEKLSHIKRLVLEYDSALTSTNY